MKNPLKNHKELLTETVFFIGNGASRKVFDLNLLKGRGTIIGCNALYRDFTPDILICQDAKMARELHEKDYQGLVLSGRGIGVRLKNQISWTVNKSRTSGAFGLNFITKVMKPKYCYVLGMDGYPGNIYESTRNYSSIIIKFSDLKIQYADAIRGETQVVNVNNRDAWEAKHLPNYKFMTYPEFLGL